MYSDLEISTSFSVRYIVRDININTKFHEQSALDAVNSAAQAEVSKVCKERDGWKQRYQDVCTKVHAVSATNFDNVPATLMLFPPLPVTRQEIMKIMIRTTYVQAVGARIKQV
jgi:hypothetical protein